MIPGRQQRQPTHDDRHGRDPSGREGNGKAGVIDARGGSTTYDSSGKMEPSSSFGRVDGAYCGATPQQIAAAVNVLGGTTAINQVLISANPNWVHNFGNAVAHDPHALIHAGVAITGGVCLMTPCAEAVAVGAFLLESANYLWEKLEK